MLIPVHCTVLCPNIVKHSAFGVGAFFWVRNPDKVTGSQCTLKGFPDIILHVEITTPTDRNTRTVAMLFTLLTGSNGIPFFEVSGHNLFARDYHEGRGNVQNQISASHKETQHVRIVVDTCGSRWIVPDQAGAHHSAIESKPVLG